MERRKIIIYSIFALTVAYGIYFHFLSGGHRKPKVGSPQQDLSVAVEGEEAVGPEAVSAGFSAASPQLEPRDRVTLPEGWSRDPFVNRSKGAGVARPTGQLAPKSLPRPKLTAIATESESPMAVVNGHVVTIGQSVGGWKVEKIEKGRVFFASPAGSIWVKLGG